MSQSESPARKLVYDPNSRLPLEPTQDCLVTDVLRFLCANNPLTGMPCPGFMMSETVVFTGAKPVAWVGCDDGLLQMRENDMKNETIYKEFLKRSFYSRKSNIVAYYIYVVVDAKGNESSKVEYFDKKALYNFLFFRKKSMTRAVLQKFVDPFEDSNSVIRVVWSQAFAMIERRINKNSIGDAQKDIIERVATFETVRGAVELSEARNLAMPVTNHIQEVCSVIVNHIWQIGAGNSTKKNKVKSIILHFKIGPRNNLWLQWVSSIRVASRNRRRSTSDPLSPASAFATDPLQLGKELELLPGPQVVRPTRIGMDARTQGGMDVCDGKGAEEIGEMAKRNNTFVCTCCKAPQSLAQLCEMTFEDVCRYFQSVKSDQLRHQEVERMSRGDRAPDRGPCGGGSATSPHRRPTSPPKWLQRSKSLIPGQVISADLCSFDKSATKESAKDVFSEFHNFWASYEDEREYAEFSKAQKQIRIQPPVQELPEFIKTMFPEVTREMFDNWRMDPFFKYRKTSVCWPCFLLFSDRTWGGRHARGDKTCAPVPMGVQKVSSIASLVDDDRGVAKCSMSGIVGLAMRRTSSTTSVQGQGAPRSVPAAVRQTASERLKDKVAENRLKNGGILAMTRSIESKRTEKYKNSEELWVEKNKSIVAKTRPKSASARFTAKSSSGGQTAVSLDDLLGIDMGFYQPGAGTTEQKQRPKTKGTPQHRRQKSATHLWSLSHRMPLSY